MAHEISQPFQHVLRAPWQATCFTKKVLFPERRKRASVQDGREGGQRCKEDTEKSVGGRGRRPKVETIADARMRLASNLGFAARKLWRRNDLDIMDEVILDLVCEALVRLGQSYRPKEGGTLAKENLARAPTEIQEMIESLVNLAKPPKETLAQIPEDYAWDISESSTISKSLLCHIPGSIPKSESPHQNFQEHLPKHSMKQQKQV